MAERGCIIAASELQSSMRLFWCCSCIFCFFHFINIYYVNVVRCVWNGIWRHRSCSQSSVPPHANEVRRSGRSQHCLHRLSHRFAHARGRVATWPPGADVRSNQHSKNQMPILCDSIFFFVYTARVRHELCMLYGRYAIRTYELWATRQTMRGNRMESYDLLRRKRLFVRVCVNCQKLFSEQTYWPGILMCLSCQCIAIKASSAIFVQLQSVCVCALWTGTGNRLLHNASPK